MHTTGLQRVIGIICLGMIVGRAAAVFGTDVPVAGTVTVVKPAKLAKLVAKPSSSVALPAPGSAQDPTLGGAQLQFFDTELVGAGSATFTLDASGWHGLGTPPGSAGYKYKGADDTTGSDCSAVLLKPKVIKAVCHGAGVTMTPPFSATEGVVLGVPTGTAALRYCAELGGTEKKNTATLMKRKGAAAPAVCPEPPTGFDANDVVALADDALQGRNNNTAGSLAAQQYIIGELQPIAAGLNSSQSGDAAFKQPFVQSGQNGTNLLAVIPGSELPNEYVIVGAHYDHLGSSCHVVTPGDTVCNGATDNAAGVAAVLAIGRGLAALPTPPRRSVILALWDAEEDGLLGSLYYVNHPLVPLASTVAYINFDIQGANLLPSLRNFTFAVGPETGVGLASLLGPATSGSTLSLRGLSYIFGQGRSDYVNFVNKSVPTVFFSDSTGPCYHTNDDEVAVVDFAKLEQQSHTAYALTLALANTTTPPTFLAPSATFATFADALVINDVLTAGLADLALFSPADQAQLSMVQTQIAAIVAAGPGNFDSSDIVTLLLDTISVIDILTRTQCSGFL